MPDSAACLDAGDAHRTFIPENSSKPAREETGRSKQHKPVWQSDMDGRRKRLQ